VFFEKNMLPDPKWQKSEYFFNVYDTAYMKQPVHH
jgi:hypothetical protein